jgi:hypothetical protein
MDVAFHYPPELFNLLIGAIPSLCRSKRDVILFFKGVGVSSNLTNDFVQKIDKDKDSISKYEITHVVLTGPNRKWLMSAGNRKIAIALESLIDIITQKARESQTSPTKSVA